MGQVRCCPSQQPLALLPLSFSAVPLAVLSIKLTPGRGRIVGVETTAVLVVVEIYSARTGGFPVTVGLGTQARGSRATSAP